MHPGRASDEPIIGSLAQHVGDIFRGHIVCLTSRHKFDPEAVSGLYCIMGDNEGK